MHIKLKKNQPMNFKKIIIIIILIIVIIQLKRINKTNPEFDVKQDYITLSNAPRDISILLKISCYDCHSNQTNYPWYINISPVSWFVANHIKDGRQHLNFSEWGTYTLKKRTKKLEECVTELEGVEMPLSSYTLMHTKAKLSAENKVALIKWFHRNPEKDLIQN